MESPTPAESPQAASTPKRRSFRISIPWVVVSILGLGIMFFLVAPFVLTSRKDAELIQATNNAKNIGLALLEFEQTYGTFPDDDTTNKVTVSGGSTITLGIRFSNDYFRQLIAAEIVQSEEMFYAKIPGARRPDGVFTSIRALEPGECGFAYLIGTTKDSPPETPLAVTPLISGEARFDYKTAKKYFLGKVVVLQKDISVKHYPIDKSGRVLINGKDIFDPSQPFWQGKTPVIKWPE